MEKGMKEGIFDIILSTGWNSEQNDNIQIFFS